MGRNNRGKGKKKKKGGGSRNTGGGAEGNGRREIEEEEDVSEMMQKIDINQPLSYAIGTRVKLPFLFEKYDKSVIPWETGTIVEHWPEGSPFPYKVRMDGTTGVIVNNTEEVFEKLDDEPPMEKFKYGSRVECQLEDSGRWFPGVVIQHFESDEQPYSISFDYGRELCFWGPPAAIRACTLPLPKNRLKTQQLRFRVGDRVECSLTGGYMPGTIIKTWYGGEKIFEDGHKVPYQIQLDMGDRIFAPMDIDEVIRKSSIPPPDCYICFDNELTEDNLIVHDCACRGSQNGFVHVGCLVKWTKSKIDLNVAPDEELNFMSCITCRQPFHTGGQCYKALTTMLFNETKHLDISNKWSKIALTGMSIALIFEDKYDAAEDLLLERISRIRSRIKHEEKSHGDVDQCWLIDLCNFYRDLASVYSTQESFEKMKDVIKEALVCMETINVSDDDDKYDLLSQRSDLNSLLGTYAYETGDYKSALEYTENAISFAKKSVKFQQGDDQSLLWLAGELNIIHGNRQRGTEQLLEAVDYITKIYGRDHMKTRNSRTRMQHILELSTEA